MNDKIRSRRFRVWLAALACSAPIWAMMSVPTTRAADKSRPPLGPAPECRVEEAGGGLSALDGGQVCDPLAGGGLAIPGVLDAGNDFYRVWVEDRPGFDRGLYTITTGPLHPLTLFLPVDVLFSFQESGGGLPSTTFNTIRSYSSGTDYVQDCDIKSSTYDVVCLKDSVAVDVEPLGDPFDPTGFRTTYEILSPDDLLVVTDVNVHGTTLEDSRIEVTTRVTNNGQVPVELGIRYHWDVAIDFDDGPSFKPLMPDQGELVIEADYSSPDFEVFRIEDNGVNTNVPSLKLFGTVSGPLSADPAPTIPDRLQFVSWWDANATAFDYDTKTNWDVATFGGDSAVHYYFGAQQDDALTISPGATAEVTALLTPELPHPEFNFPPSPRCGATLTIEAGQPFDFDVAAFDSDPAQVVTLDVFGLPAGAAMAPPPPVQGNPAALTFFWVPSFSDIGSETLVTFVATDDVGLDTSCSVVIRVVELLDLLVQLAAFDVRPEDGRVTVEWQTVAELDNVGFYVWREDLLRGTSERVSGFLPSLAAPLSGASYAFTDDSAVNGVEYRYWLEDIDSLGASRAHPGLVTVPNPGQPEVALREPAYGAAVEASATLLAFEGAAEGLAVWVSADPEFGDPRGLLRILPTAGGEARLRPLDCRRLSRLASESGGAVYWRVAAPDSPGRPASPTWRFSFMNTGGEPATAGRPALHREARRPREREGER